MYFQHKQVCFIDTIDTIEAISSFRKSSIRKIWTSAHQIPPTTQKYQIFHKISTLMSFKFNFFF